MRYREFEPRPELKSWIKLFWIFECRSEDPIPETLVADGCPELIIHFRTPFAEIGCSGQELVMQPTAVACGQLTRPLVLQSSLDAGMFGIRFQPHGMTPFISAPMKSLTDARIAAVDLFKGIDQLVEEMLRSSNDERRVAACNRFLIRSLDFDRENVGIQRALDRIWLSRGRISVKSLSELMGVSRRSLELTFQKAVGISPKMYCRVVRFRNVYDAMSNESSLNWIRIALDSGFFDQPHLIRDFRQFAGESPTAFLAGQTQFAQSVN